MIVIYHDPCPDGCAAAWVLWRRETNAGRGGSFKMYPAQYGTFTSWRDIVPGPVIRDQEVVIADFCFNTDQLNEMAVDAKSVFVLDHHKSAKAMVKRTHLQDNVIVIFDMDRSGAQMAWDWCYPDLKTRRPRLVEYVADHDLWKKALPDTELIQAVINSTPMLAGCYDTLAQQLKNTFRKVADGGAAILQYKERCIEQILKRVRVVDFPEDIGLSWEHGSGYIVPIVNVSDKGIGSEVGHRMCREQPFSIMYWDEHCMRVFSLRSQEGGEDVSIIAAKFGGGGHEHAAGFEIPLEYVKGYRLKEDQKFDEFIKPFKTEEPPPIAEVATKAMKDAKVVEEPPPEEAVQETRNNKEPL